MLVDQASQTQQGINGNPGLLFEHHRLAASGVQHPTRDLDSQIIVHLHNSHRHFSRSESAQNLDLLVKKRVESISDPSRTELMSSVLIRAAKLGLSN